MPHADERRGAVAVRTARPDQQRQKKALAALDIPLMRAGRARMRPGEQRNRRAPVFPADARGKTRQAVLDQAEIDQRDCRALPDRLDAAAWKGQDPPLSATERMTSRSKIAIIEETVEPAIVGAVDLAQIGQPSPFSAASRSPRPAAGSRRGRTARGNLILARVKNESGLDRRPEKCAGRVYPRGRRQAGPVNRDSGSGGNVGQNLGGFTNPHRPALPPSAGVGDGALLGVADGLGVFPQRAGLVVVPARRPGAAALGQLGVAERDVDRAGDGVDRDLSPSRSSAIGPPTAASGPTWPMQKPCVAPEKRPSVISATFSPTPWP